MRRLARILINAVTALSAVLALATAGLWVRSYSTCDRIWTSNCAFSSELGGLYFTPIGREPDQPFRDCYPAGSGELGLMEQEWSDGVRRLRPMRILRTNLLGWLFVVPHWFAALTFAVLPAYRLAQRVRRRQPPGHCPDCGYDLRATPERCPECGTIPAR